MDLPAPVAAVCGTFLAAVPSGLVTGLYLRGGLGFGEWVPGQSDVDFVATLSRRPDRADVGVLRSAHEHVAAEHPGLPFDGMHVLARDLSLPPDDLPDGPCVLHHHFEAEGCLDPMVAWHELAWHGITVAGPDHASLGIWTDRQRLVEFTRDNLDTYWRATAEALDAMPSEGAAETACCWCVLGVARLDHLLVTGRMTTKSGAGRWGLSHYPERFHRVLREALRIRGDIRDGGGDEYPDDRGGRGHDTAEFTAYVVEAGTA